MRTLRRLGIVILVCRRLGRRRLRGRQRPPAPAGDGVTAPASSGPGATTGPADAAGNFLDLTAEKSPSASSLEAGVGEVTIRFANDEGVPHNLRVTGAGVDDKTDVAPGPMRQRLAMTPSGTYTYTYTYTYACDVHPTDDGRAHHQMSPPFTS